MLIVLRKPQGTFRAMRGRKIETRGEYWGNVYYDWFTDHYNIAVSDMQYLVDVEARYWLAECRYTRSKDAFQKNTKPGHCVDVLDNVAWTRDNYGTNLKVTNSAFSLLHAGLEDIRSIKQWIEIEFPLHSPGVQDYLRDTFRELNRMEQELKEIEKMGHHQRKIKITAYEKTATGTVVTNVKIV